ncbi:MAG: hypothetical protein OXI81_01335 [Paracoccaceae bacterium]|nr:hypothetical protein [Paracoccaceae bacterium]
MFEPLTKRISAEPDGDTSADAMPPPATRGVEKIFFVSSIVFIDMI